MKKMMCVILGLAFLAQGILGITGLVTMLQSDPVYLNIAEIVLGGLGFFVGVYARQNVVYSPQKIMSAQQENDIDQQRKEIDQLKKEINELKKESKEKIEDKGTGSTTT